MKGRLIGRVDNGIAGEILNKLVETFTIRIPIRFTLM